MTANQHTDHIATGQQLNQHSLPTFLYFLFARSHIFFNSILVSHIPKAFGSRLGFALHTDQHFAKAQEPFFINTPITDFTNIKLTLPTEF